MNNKESMFSGEKNKVIKKETEFFTPAEIDKIKKDSLNDFKDFQDQKAKGLIKTPKPKKQYGGTLPGGLQDFSDEGSVVGEMDNADNIDSGEDE